MRHKERQLVHSVLLAVTKSPAAMRALDAKASRDAKRLFLRLRDEFCQPKAPPPNAKQASIFLSYVPRSSGKRRGVATSVRYPFQMVQDARLMRDNRYEYREIAEALSKEYKIEVQWGTVRDWVTYRSRQTR